MVRLTLVRLAWLKLVLLKKPCLRFAPWMLIPYKFWFAKFTCALTKIVIALAANIYANLDLLVLVS